MPFLTGAIPSPKSKAYGVQPFLERPGIPASWGVVPSKLDAWANDQYGDCVTAEEAWATAAYSSMLGLPETFITAATVVAWCRKHGYLNGAMLTDVMDTRAKTGLTAEDGKVYTDGPYQSVDWNNFAVLSSAIFSGPVKIGVDHRPLSAAGAGNGNGWLVQGSGRHQNIDHCVGLGGYGTVADCYKILKMPPPAKAKLDSQAVLLFTWGTIGVVDMGSLDGMTAEAWLRTPTNPEITPPAPPTPPPPTPGPPPPIPIGHGIYLDPVSRTITLPPDWSVVPTF